MRPQNSWSGVFVHQRFNEMIYDKAAWDRRSASEAEIRVKLLPDIKMSWPAPPDAMPRPALGQATGLIRSVAFVRARPIVSTTARRHRRPKIASAVLAGERDLASDGAGPEAGLDNWKRNSNLLV
jgi:hypothetical protein